VLILAIDTSTPHGSVALLADGVVRLDEQFTAERGHSALLFPILERARSLAPRLDLVAVGLGPGSYAGVRISIAAALGFAMGTGSPLAGIPSVAALRTEARRYVAIGDARRATFYFTEVEDGACVAGPRLLTESELHSALTAHPLPIFGSAPLPGFPQVTVTQPCAVRLARLAAADRGVVARGDLEPIYLRDPHITQPRTRA
jgi:tRNA threonylcarbamoyladenosine biosynthesis protein TsaB